MWACEGGFKVRRLLTSVCDSVQPFEPSFAARTHALELPASLAVSAQALGYQHARTPACPCLFRTISGASYQPCLGWAVEWANVWASNSLRGLFLDHHSWCLRGPCTRNSVLVGYRVYAGTFHADSSQRPLPLSLRAAGSLMRFAQRADAIPRCVFVFRCLYPVPMRGWWTHIPNIPLLPNSLLLRCGVKYPLCSKYIKWAILWGWVRFLVSAFPSQVTLIRLSQSVKMSGLLYADMSYCSICDRYFPGEDAKMHHIQISPNHPKCETCNKRFANKHALRNVSVLLSIKSCEWPLLNFPPRFL